MAEGPYSGASHSHILSPKTNRAFLEGASVFIDVTVSVNTEELPNLPIRVPGISYILIRGFGETRQRN